MSNWLQRIFTIPKSQNSLQDLIGKDGDISRLIAALPLEARVQLYTTVKANADAAINQAGGSLEIARLNLDALLKKWLKIEA